MIMHKFNNCDTSSSVGKCLTEFGLMFRLIPQYEDVQFTIASYINLYLATISS